MSAKGIDPEGLPTKVTSEGEFSHERREEDSVENGGDERPNYYGGGGGGV